MIVCIIMYTSLVHALLTKKLLLRHQARMGTCNLGSYNAATMKPVAQLQTNVGYLKGVQLVELVITSMWDLRAIPSAILILGFTLSPR